MPSDAAKIEITRPRRFTTGAVAESDGSLKVYYGGADTVQCLAFGDVEELVWSCLNE